jgi:hypothetical protein
MWIELHLNHKEAQEAQNSVIAISDIGLSIFDPQITQINYLRLARFFASTQQDFEVVGE